MNDFDFDVLQKKRVAASARRRVCGSKSKFCGLPSDNLTPAQLKAKNGPCDTYNLNAPMDYETFKAMPKDLQQKYLDGLKSRFCVGCSTISEGLFHKSASTLSLYMKNNGLKPFSGKRLSPDEREAWAKWLSNEDAPDVEEVVQEPDEKEAEPEPTGNASLEDIAPYVPVEPLPCEKEAEESGLQVSDLAATFTGKFEPEKFLKWVAMLPMPEGKVKIRVEVMTV